MRFDAVRAELAALLDEPVELLVDDFDLADHANWDSLAKVALVAFVVGDTGRALDAAGMDDVRTVADLWRLLGAHSEGVTP